MFEIPAGGRRYRALELLGEAEAPRQDRAGSLRRAPRGNRRGGFAGRERAARRAASARSIPRVPDPARQRARRRRNRRAVFRLARRSSSSGCASPRSRRSFSRSMPTTSMTLEQLMAFTVSEDHARQEQVWEALGEVLQQEAYQIRQHADAKRRSRERPPGDSSDWTPITRRRAASCSTTSSPTIAAAGCRTLRCSIGWREKSSSARPRRSAPRAGSGSSSRPSFPAGMTEVCDACRASRRPPRGAGRP